MPNQVIVPLQPGWDIAFKSPIGILGMHLLERGTAIETAAKRQVGVRTGNLRASIGTSLGLGPTGELMVRVGSEVDHALPHHEGTQPHVIHPRSARILRWVNKSGEVVYALRVNHPGTNPNHYLGDNLPLAIV